MSTMEKLLEQAYTALSNAATVAEISTILAIYGYSPERIQEGRSLYERANEWVRTQSGAQLNEATATKGFQQSWQRAQVHYYNDLRTARVALKQHGIARAFANLTSVRIHSFDSWYEQAKSFYQELSGNPAWQMITETMGLDGARVEASLQSLQALKAARLQQRAQRINVGGMRQQRDEAFQALMRWMLPFRQIARIALASTPQHLATLGLDTSLRMRKKKTVKLPVATSASDTIPMLRVGL